MVSPIPNAVLKIWEKCNIRVVILFSLFLQTFLIVFAPLRKRTRASFPLWSIWSAYLLADWAANFCVGLISNSQDYTSNSTSTSTSISTSTSTSTSTHAIHVDTNNCLISFWAPFLLLHLGGPDTITAFALEDNELWLRHLLGLVFQAVAAAYVFLLTIPGNTLWIPTLLMFAAGTIKYAERTRALYLASINTFRRSMVRDPDPGPNYAKLMEEHYSRNEAGLPTSIEMMPEPAHHPHQKQSRTKNGAPAEEEELTDMEVVKNAYDLFDRYRGLIVDMIFSFGERNESRELFLDMKPKDALRVIEVELNYIYEVFFTKVSVLRHKVGYFFRFVSFSSIVASLWLFILEDKHGFNDFDVKVTYVLLYGALALDAVGLLMLFFSNRTVVTSYDKSKTRKNSNKASVLDLVENVKTDVLEYFISFRRPSWSTCKEEPYTKYKALSTPLMFRRWSGTISGHNLITYCLRQCPIECPKVDTTQGYKFVVKAIILFCCFKARLILKSPLNKVVNYFGAKDILEMWIYKANNPFLEELWKFIFEELERKSQKVEDVKTTQTICSARGEKVLAESNNKKVIEKLMPYVDGNEVAFDESLVTWHIATHLCYAHDQEQDGEDDKRQFSKLLADYMLYLLVMQPSLMSAVAGIGQIRFQDTCAEAIKFFSKRDLDEQSSTSSNRERKKEITEKAACRKLLEVHTDLKPILVKGDRSKSLLFEACRLAKELRTLKKKKWEIISRIWVEMLSFAACNCRPTTLVQQLSKGGELISFVWLLMVHLGIGKQFQIKDGHVRAKLIVDK